MDTPETTDDGRGEAKATMGRWALRIAATLLILCALYVLSIGPAVAIAERIKFYECDSLESAIWIAYMPVTYLLAIMPPDGPHVRYVEWWASIGRDES
jgi:hypothetical protein